MSMLFQRNREENNPRLNFDIFCYYFPVKSVFLLWGLHCEHLCKSSSQNMWFQWVNYIFRKNTGEFQNRPAGSSYTVNFLYIHLCWRHTVSISFKMTNYLSPPASPTFAPANQWLICTSSLLFWFNFILY